MMEEVKIENFIGISVRTTNANSLAAKDLETLWNKFYSEKVMDEIPGKLSEDIYAVYTDYETDYTGEYTAIIGCVVNSLENIPIGLVGRSFKPENFKVFTAKGQMPDAIINTWREIWLQDETLRRKYTYDFEVYGSKSNNGQHSEVNIFIAVETLA